MSQFNIFHTIKKEIDEFENQQITLAKVQPRDNNGRYLMKKKGGSMVFNQRDTLNLIDLYYNSQFENGDKDSVGDEKLFLNVGKFRCEVASKQIDIDTKNFRFISDDYANPFTAVFLQKEFKEWAKGNYFGEVVNRCVEAFPKYGTIVLKKVPNVLGMVAKYSLSFVSLKTLRNEQDAQSLQESAFVHEDHTNMRWWEMEKMTAWDLSGLEPDYDCKYHIIERYGYVPVDFLKSQNKEESLLDDEGKWVNALTVIAKDVEVSEGKKDDKVLFCGVMEERPYQEAHYNQIEGRWLGMGVVEDLVPNQRAKNIVVNLAKRDMQWAAKHLFKTKEDMDIVQNLFRDTRDGDLMNVGVQGDILQVDTISRNTTNYQQFLNEWERNADQKAFTYEVATGEQMNSNTPFRLGVLLTNAVNSYFGLKQERLGLFLQRAMEEFIVPDFIREIGNKERLVQFFSDEPGFEVLKEAAMKLAMWDATITSLLSGVSVDATTITDAIQPFDAIDKLMFNLPPRFYKEANLKFELIITGENKDIQQEMQTLSTLAQLLPPGDPRKDKMMSRIAELGGVTWSAYNSDKPNMQQIAQPVNQPQAKQPMPNAPIAPGA